jgi:hypothetical protein
VLELHFLERNRQAQGGNPPNQRLEHDLQFGPGQLLPDALVRAETEPEVLGGGPAQSQPVRLLPCPSRPSWPERDRR